MRLDPHALGQYPAHIRQQAEAMLAEYEELVRANPLHGYYPHVKQVVFHQAQDPIKAFFGGNRSGKTTAAIADNIIQTVDVSALPEHLKPFKKWDPPFMCRVVSPDFTSTMEGAIFQKIRELVPREQLLGGSWERAYDKQRRRLNWRNGSSWDFLTSEQDIDKFGGVALHRVHYDEEPPGDKGRQIRNECRMRLIDYAGDEVFSMTPLLGMSWVYDEIWEKRGVPTSKGIYTGNGLTVVTVDMDENPHLSSEAKDRILAGLTKQEREARKQGRFVHFQGLVYDEFNPDRHTVTPPTAEDLHGLDVYVGIDPGIRTTGIVFTAFDRDNSMLVFDELYLHDQEAIPEVAAAKIRQKLHRWNINSANFIIDPSARIRTMTTAEQTAAAYSRAGIPCIPGQNAVEAGVFEIKRRLQAGSFKVSKACGRWLWECERYRIKPMEDGTFAVVKRDDHLLDPTRYVAMQRVWGPAPKTDPFKPPPSWRYGFQPPYNQERPYAQQPPMGALS